MRQLTSLEDAGKDKLVEAMPFFDRKLADTLGEFLKGIKVASSMSSGALADSEPFDRDEPLG